MCTYLTLKTDVMGTAWNGDGWIPLARAVVSFDHPQEAPIEHALCIDFRAASGDPRARVAVELDAASARRLAEAILATLDSPDARTLEVS